MDTTDCLRKSSVTASEFVPGAADFAAVTWINPQWREVTITDAERLDRAAPRLEEGLRNSRHWNFAHYNLDSQLGNCSNISPVMLRRIRGFDTRRRQAPKVRYGLIHWLLLAFTVMDPLPVALLRSGALFASGE